MVRLVDFQAGRTACDRNTWGKIWGRSLRELGASLGVVPETGLCGDAAVAAAVHGVASVGYAAIAHGVQRGRGRETSQDLSLANGVLLAARTGYPRSPGRGWPWPSSL